MPDTDILNQEQVAEIEARNKLSHISPEIDALCRTLRAAWARIEKQNAIISAYENNDEEALAEAENL